MGGAGGLWQNPQSNPGCFLAQWPGLLPIVSRLLKARHGHHLTSEESTLDPQALEEEMWAPELSTPNCHSSTPWLSDSALAAQENPPRALKNTDPLRPTV